MAWFERVSLGSALIDASSRYEATTVCPSNYCFADPAHFLQALHVSSIVCSCLRRSLFKAACSSFRSCQQCRATAFGYLSPGTGTPPGRLRKPHPGLLLLHANFLLPAKFFARVIAYLNATSGLQQLSGTVSAPLGNYRCRPGMHNNHTSSSLDDKPPRISCCMHHLSRRAPRPIVLASH